MIRNEHSRWARPVLAVALSAFCFLLAAVALAFAALAGSAVAAGCSNEALRTGPSAALPGCRAYEMVSPPDKNGGSINNVESMRTSPSGDVLSFYSTASFAGAVSSPLGNAYLGRRGANWSTEAVDPPLENPLAFVTFASPASSIDQGTTLQASTFALTPGAIADGSNLYLRDNASGRRTLVEAVPGFEVFQRFGGAGGGLYVGGSRDWSHLLLHSEIPLLPGEETAQYSIHLYEFDGGELRAADVLPDGERPSGVQYPTASNSAYQHQISADGSRIFFTAPNQSGEEAVYLRENGATTRAISVPQGAPPGTEAEEGEFQLASADGSVVYFTSYRELVPGVETQDSKALYRYEVATGTLTDVTPTAVPGGPQVGEVLAASEDGSYVYFSAVAGLAEGATEAEPNSGGLYAWHDGRTELVWQTAPEQSEFSFSARRGGSGAVAAAGGAAGGTEQLASPNGRYFAFASYSPLTPDDQPSPACAADPGAGAPAEACLDVFAFDYATEALSCISCNGQPARGNSNLGGQESHEAGTGDEYPRAVLDDGTVFVDTPNRLLPRDANGIGDVYAWRGGEYQLISTGSDVQPSFFGNATADGSDVFFLTDQQLVGQDTDNSVDAYDAREGGGLADQWPPGSSPACEAEGCRGASPSAPAGLAAGSDAAVAGACGEQRAAARAARQRVTSFARRARRVAKSGGVAAKAHSRRLRRQAAAARESANRLQKKAENCGGKSK